MPIFKTKNENFFKKWTPEMAYVLGFFCADGSLTKGHRSNYYLEFTSIDKGLLVKIKNAMNSSHKITGRKRSKRWQTEHRLQIGSKTLVNDLIALGITARKSLKIKLPSIPDKSFAHFVRGYFDGDGNIVCGYFKKSDRPKKVLVVATRFTSGSKNFLAELKNRLSSLINVSGSLFYSTGWRLNYGRDNSKKLFKFMYGTTSKNLIYLKRKYNIYLRAKTILRW